MPPLQPGCNGSLKGNGSKTDSNKQNCGSALPDPKVVLYPPEKVSLGWRGELRPGAGMANLGNTCYLNATLQALFHVPAVGEWLSEHMDSEHMKGCELKKSQSFGFEECVICSMARTYQQSQNTTIVEPHLINKKLKLICPHMSHGAQEDAHEFLRGLLDNMEEAYVARFKDQKLDTYSKQTTPINQIFGGYTRTELKCPDPTCLFTSTSFEHFLDISLPILEVSSVDEALHNYFMPEMLDGDNLFTCPKCKQKVHSLKKFSIERPPKVLCIHLKRFDAQMKKCSKMMQYQSSIDLIKYIHLHSPYSKYQSLPYMLVSMITHEGPCFVEGHYTATAQCLPGSYHLFNDSEVFEIGRSLALSQIPYILLYEMEPGVLAQGPKSDSTSTVTSNSALTINNHNVANGVSNNIQTSTGLSPVKDGARVMLGMTPPESTCAQPQIVMNSERLEQLVLPQKSSIISDGSLIKESSVANFIGLVQVVTNGKSCEQESNSDSSSKHPLSRKRRSRQSSESESPSNKLLKKKDNLNDNFEGRLGSKPINLNGSQITAFVEDTEEMSGTYGTHPYPQSSSSHQSSSWNGDANSSSVNDLLEMAHQGFGNDRGIKKKLSKQDRCLKSQSQKVTAERSDDDFEPESSQQLNCPKSRRYYHFGVQLSDTDTDSESECETDTDNGSDEETLRTYEVTLGGKTTTLSAKSEAKAILLACVHFLDMDIGLFNFEENPGGPRVRRLS